MGFSKTLRPGSSMQAALSNLRSTRTRRPGQDAATALGTHQTGSSCFGWLMSVDYCHWVGCCIQQGTAAFPIRQLHLNGQQMHNEARGRGNSCSGSDSHIYFLPGNSLCNLLNRRSGLSLLHRKTRCSQPKY